MPRGPGSHHHHQQFRSELDLTVMTPTICSGVMGIPTDIKTDSALLKRLATRVKTQVSREQLRQQRISYIYGQLPADGTITLEQIEAVLAKMEGKAG